MRAAKSWLRKWRHDRKDRCGFTHQFEYRPTDVILVSYPKSGSTWMRFILAHLLRGPNGNGEAMDFEQLHGFVPELSSDALKRGIDFQKLPSPRVMRSHKLCFAGFPKVIYLLRDGRDVMVSYYHHFRKFNQFEGTFRDFLIHAKRPSEWGDHVEGWIFQNPGIDRVCLIRYEALLEDAVGEARKVAQFCGLSCSMGDIEHAVARSTFQEMRRIEDTKGLGSDRSQDVAIPFIRQGTKGGWKASFGPEERAYFKERFGGTLIRAGYESSMIW